MQDTLIIAAIGIVFLVQIAILYFIYTTNTRVRDVTKTLTHQYNLIVKIQSTLKNKSATNAVAENAEMISTAEMLGIRASRRIRGEYILTVEDYLHRAVFDDEICRCAYAIDIHPHKNDESSYDKFWSDYTVRYKFKPGESYGIPYRCLIPESSKNFLVAGRCISTDHYVQASVRIMPACFVMGQAAGTAAALSAQSQMDVADIPVARLQKRLIDRGVCLPNYKEQSAQ